jgi:hypothetical protein
MYVEISPRQSGKTTRLVEAAATFLRENRNSTIVIVSHSAINSREIKKKIREKLVQDYAIEEGLNIPTELAYRTIDFLYTNNIDVRHNTLVGLGRTAPDYWFFDEFAYINLPDIFPGVAIHNDHQRGNRVGWGNQIITNAYYCTTPGSRQTTTEVLVRWCQENNQIINFVNPWTERRLEEQDALGPYMRDAVLGDWVDFMRQNGFPMAALKENWLSKMIKRHKFI